PESDLARFEQLQESGELPPHTGAEPRRRLYRVGNREFLTQPFRWVSLFDVASIERPEEPLFLERLDWGIFIGMPEAIIERRQRELPPGAELVEEETVDGRRTVRHAEGETPEGATRIVEDVYLAEDPAAVWATFQRLHPETVRLRAEIKALNRGALEDINRRIERQRLRIRA